MRAENVISALRARRRSLEESAYTKPLEDFVRNQGIWQGLGDAMSIVEDELKKEMNDG